MIYTGVSRTNFLPSLKMPWAPTNTGVVRADRTEGTTDQAAVNHDAPSGALGALYKAGQTFVGRTTATLGVGLATAMLLTGVMGFQSQAHAQGYVHASGAQIELSGGTLTIKGTDLPETINIHQSGGEVHVDYRVFDHANNERGRGQQSFDADDVKQFQVFAWGGNDVVRNGFKDKHGRTKAGVDNGFISVGGGVYAPGDNNRVTNYGDRVQISGGMYAAGLQVTDHGSHTNIEGTPGADALYMDGYAPTAHTGPGDMVGNLADGAKLSSSGGGTLVSVADRVTVDAQNGWPDRGIMVGDHNAAYVDPVDTGDIGTSQEMRARYGSGFEAKARADIASLKYERPPDD